ERSKEQDECSGQNEGTVKEFIPNKRVSYTWQFKDAPEFPETTATWELEETDTNKTRVELVNSGFTGKEEGKLSSGSHDQGWTYFLGRLKRYCEKTK
ncbi:MAG TPA: SRPBCC domain-containing protein, partial [Methylomirabilota bacterium]|nr:SRPBCC domain-containing protein [Methylomirabilota bacterium]